MTTSILGCGWYGKALGTTLAAKGMRVNGSTTSEDKVAGLAALGILPFVVEIDADDLKADPAFFNCDVLVISIPPRLRKDEGADYLPKLKHAIEAIKYHEIKKVIYTSSTGVYGDRNNEVNERTDPQPDSENGVILRQAELLFENEISFKTAILRFGGLIGPGRDPGKFFAGKTNIPNGRAPVNLIRLEDCVGTTKAVIERDAFGYVFNACSPEHPTKTDFYRDAAACSGLPLPEFIDELGNWKIVNSINVPQILGYQFTASLNS